MNIPHLSAPALRNDLAVRPAVGAVTPSLEACGTATYDNGTVCGELPIIGKKCFHIGGPNISATAKVCVSPSFFPPGITACVYVQDVKLGCVSI